MLAQIDGVYHENFEFLPQEYQSLGASSSSSYSKDVIKDMKSSVYFPLHIKDSEVVTIRPIIYLTATLIFHRGHFHSATVLLPTRTQYDMNLYHKRFWWNRRRPFSPCGSSDPGTRCKFPLLRLHRLTSDNLAWMLVSYSNSQHLHSLWFLHGFFCDDITLLPANLNRKKVSWILFSMLILETNFSKVVSLFSLS